MQQHPSLTVRRISFILLAFHPFAIFICTHFIDDSGIFSNLFFVPLVLMSWVMGGRKVLLLVAYGVAINSAVLGLEYGAIQRLPFDFLNTAIKAVIGFILYTIVGFVVGWLSDTNRALNKALNEVKMLRGLIPICAKCKKIRDDRGYWRQIEVYLRDHSEAEFSHGLCPNCARELYGDAATPPEAAGKAVR